MGKKGVLLDNGKKAQSSMSLYWKKHQQQSKQPKKQYQPTQQQQQDQRAETGFAKWKQYKQKMISKAYQKKQKADAQNSSQKVSEMKQQDEDQFEQKIDKKMAITNIPGFKSKQSLKNRLKVEHKKDVDQTSNKLKLPSHLSSLSQEQISRILKSKKQLQTSRKQFKQQKQDVMLGEDFLQSFTKKPKQQENLQKEVVLNEPQIPKQQNFFKSDILNQISKGNGLILHQNKQKEVSQVLQQIETKLKQQKIKDQQQQKSNVINSIFKSRILGNKK